MKDRIYICHTFYHVYVAALKECAVIRRAKEAGQEPGGGTLMLSLMSTNFGALADRARKCGLFENVVEFDEKREEFFPELAKWHVDTGSLPKNLLNRIRFTRRLGELEAPFVPVDLKEYGDIYVFCDSDPIGYYLNRYKIRYHAVEDGLNCLKIFDAARYDNQGHFGLKAFLSKLGLIFIQNGYGRCCIDMEVNDISVLQAPMEKYVEVPREPLVAALTKEQKEAMLVLFLDNIDALESALTEAGDGTGSGERVLILSEPLCDMETRPRLFKDIIDRYAGDADAGIQNRLFMKIHPRDLYDYAADPAFAGIGILPGTFPMEMMKFIDGIHFEKVVSVYTAVDAITFADEKITLGHDFMDRYEDPALHRKNGYVKNN